MGGDTPPIFDWFDFMKKTFSLFFISLVSCSAIATQLEKPQFIMLTMDDGVNSLMEDSIALIEHNVPWTFYVNVVQQPGGWNYDEALLDIECTTEDGTSTGNPACVSDPVSVKNLYEKGNEIALHTYSHAGIGMTGTPLTAYQVEREIGLNYEFFLKAGVEPKDIRGFRAPFLATMASGGWDKEAKNEQLRNLQVAFNQYSIDYDSTFSSDINKATPIKGARHCSPLDANWEVVSCGLKDEYFNYPESQGGYPDYTNVSYPYSNHLFMAKKYANGGETQLMDTVFSQCSGNCTPEDAKAIWMENFELHYYSESRAPYGIFLHRQSLMNQAEVEGLNQFIATIQSSYPNTYFATASQIHDYYELGLTLAPEQIKKFLSK
jgi:peptidoglycan/xylan/chitin deacetylase (PgdA/CDA1 family)